MECPNVLDLAHPGSSLRVAQCSLTAIMQSCWSPRCAHSEYMPQAYAQVRNDQVFVLDRL